MSKLLTRPQLWAFLREAGFPIADSTGEKLCAVGEGPPVECWWGRRALTTPDKAIAWAQSRLSSKKGSLPGVPPRVKQSASAERFHKACEAVAQELGLPITDPQVIRLATLMATAFRKAGSGNTRIRTAQSGVRPAAP